MVKWKDRFGKITEGEVLASSGSLDGIKKLIAQYTYDPIERIVLTPISDTQWEVSKINPDKAKYGMVVLRRGKYFFEDL